MKRFSMTVRIKEPLSALSHLVGVGFAVVALVLLVTRAAAVSTAAHVVGFAIFGTCMVLVYTASTLYHALPLKVSQEKIFRRIDHSTIFTMIAGTYTPVALVVLKGPIGWSLLVLIWSLAAYGIWRLWRKKRPSTGVVSGSRWQDAAIYVGMGWVSVLYIWPMAQVLPAAGIAWLLGGGAAYSLGAVIYGLKRPNPWPRVFGFHEIFHGFVLLGSFCHFWLMHAYVLPLQT